MMNNDPCKIWSQYNKGITYKQNLNLYHIVEENEDYYNDKQWGDLNAPDLDKPVMNFLKPVVNLYVALLISDDIAVNIKLGAGSTPEARELVPKIVSTAVDDIMEQTNMRYHFRRAIRNAALDGDSAAHIYYDVGDDQIKFEILDNTNVYFGDTSTGDVQSQPYIIIAYRRLTEELKRRCEDEGLNADGIMPDADDSLYMNVHQNPETQYTTVLRKYYKDKGSVHVIETTRTMVLKEDTDLGLKLYPLAWFTWEEVKNSYHGISPITGKIANQQYVNKMFAMSMHYCKLYAFPKTVYDKTKLPQGWNNAIGKAIGVNGNPRESVLVDSVGGAGFNSQAIELANQTISTTKDLMGASDAALGNVKPDNTSAIIAVQKAANAPLDIQRLIYYNFVEDIVREIVDIMRVYYGERNYLITNGDGGEVEGRFNYAGLAEYNSRITVDIGQGSYWSELMQVQTLDNLMSGGLLPDAVTYFECLPDGYVKNKQLIIDKWQETLGNQQMMAQGQQMPQQMNEPTGEQIAGEIANSPFAEEMTDDKLSQLCAELMQIPPEKRDKVINALKLSDETKNKIRQLIAGQEQGGNQNAVSQM